MTKIIGLIAEDDSDIEVLKILAAKISNRRFSTKHFVGKGCGPLKRKLPGWCKALLDKGVSSIAVIHDLDKNDLAALRSRLDELLPKDGLTHRAVIIPVEELEAWLLSDEVAIETAMKLQSRPKTIHHPEKVTSPKEHLGRIVRDHSKDRLKQYVNTVHNKLIAQSLSPDKLAKCSSFSDFRDFIRNAT